MKKVYSTKNALISSVVLLALCFSMLVGTTFAWFTDSAASTGNIIETGNLNVEMYWADGTKAVPADKSADWQNASAGAIFSHTLWEPGYAEVRHIKIANEGSLALKYKVNIIANGEVSELSDVIDVYYVDPAVQVPGADALVDDYYIGTLTEVLAKLGETGSGELEAGKADTITIALRMNKDAGNKYQGMSIGTDFSIQLLATQLASEKDSFGDQYDADADYAAIVNNASELATAIKAGGNVILNSDIALAEGEKIVVAEGTVAAIDLNGKTITGGFQQGSTAKHVYAIENRGQLTLDGDGVVSGRGVANYGNLTIDGGTYNAIDTNGGGCVWNYAGTVTVNEGAFITWDAAVAPAATCLNVAAGSEAIINGGTFTSNANQTAAIINNGTLTINNIDLTSDHNVIGNVGTVTINGGSFELVGVEGQTSNMIYTSSGLVTINGGSFIYDKNNVLDSGHLLTFAGGEIVVNGGNFEGYVTTQLDNYGYSSGKATVYGGTFDQDPSSYVASGYSVSETSGKFVVTKNANVGPTVNVVVNTAAELQAALTPSVSDGKAVIEIGSDIELAAGETWSPLNMDPYAGGAVNQVIINGNGHTIKGLNAPLIGDVHFGSTQVMISDLTLTDCQILDQCYNSGLGAFVSYADRSDLITLDNCHLKDSTVRASAGTGVGGLIGYSSSTLVIDGCSVTNCTISGATQSAGAIAGHVSADGSNTTTMTSVKVVECVVTGERADKTGYVLGTANVGVTTITTVDCSSNTVFGVADSTKIYGRYKGSDTSSLVVNGESMPQD